MQLKKKQADIENDCQYTVVVGVDTIKADKLNIYQSLISASRHISAAYNINYIERNNLNLRTHLKRLSRRTICFSKSLLMLECCL